MKIILAYEYAYELVHHVCTNGNGQGHIDKDEAKDPILQWYVRRARINVMMYQG